MIEAMEDVEEGESRSATKASEFDKTNSVALLDLTQLQNITITTTTTKSKNGCTYGEEITKNNGGADGGEQDSEKV